MKNRIRNFLTLAVTCLAVTARAQWDANVTLPYLNPPMKTNTAVMIDEPTGTRIGPVVADTNQFGPDASRLVIINGAVLPGFSVQGPALSLVSTQADFTEPFIQGMAYDGTNRWIFCTDQIVATGKATNAAAATATFTERVYDHLGDGDYFAGNLYVPLQVWKGCGSSSNLSVGIFDAETLAGKAVVHVDSDGLPEISCAAVDDDASVLYLASYCDGSQILKYSISGETNLTFQGSVTLSQVTTKVQGSTVKDGILYLSGGEPPVVKVYAVDPATGEAQVMVSTNMGTTEIEGLAVADGKIECYVVGSGPVRFAVTNSPVFRVSKLSGLTSENNSLGRTNIGIDDGLVLYYPFGEAAGLDVYDQSGNGIDGQIESETVRTNQGLFGRGLRFFGTNHLSATSTPTISGMSNITVSVWWKREASGGSYGLTQKHQGGTDGEFFINSAGNQTLQFTTVNDVSTRVNLAVTGLPLLNDDRWHLVAGTYDGDKMRLWLDGNCVGTASQTNALKATTNPLIIGGDNSKWIGAVDEYKLWNRALRTNEIVSLWEAGGVGLTTNLNVVTSSATNVFRFINGKLSTVQ